VEEERKRKKRVLREKEKRRPREERKPKAKRTCFKLLARLFACYFSWWKENPFFFSLLWNYFLILVRCWKIFLKHHNFVSLNLPFFLLTTYILGVNDVIKLVDDTT
jgi:hypothetical protein